MIPDPDSLVPTGSADAVGRAAHESPRSAVKAGIPALTVGYHSKLALAASRANAHEFTISAETMSRPDEQQRRRHRDAAAAPGPSAQDAPPSKTRRKAEMHALQDLGERLIGLDDGKLDALAAEALLPERLQDAVRDARKINAWGARKRQLQFIGRLMREVDPAPIEQRLEAWSQGLFADTARQHALERWRTRLLDEPGGLDALAIAYPALDPATLRPLIAKARDERLRGTPPHAYRELFRALKALDGGA
jgi:ribosome-associated protein